ncbi:MAG: helix-turn-helix domain-containing protein [Patescibacteria group bacterium]
MSELEDIANTGLTNRQAEAYLALLQLKEATVKEVSEKTKESRTHLYDTLSSLISLGLVAYTIKNNTKYFYAAPPQKLLDFLKEKERALLKILPSLTAYHETRHTKPLVEIYEGKEGMKTILNDIVRTKKEWLAIGSTGQSPYVLYDFYIEHFHKDRVKNKVNLKVLFNDTEDARKRAEVFSKIPLIEAKYLLETHQSPTTIYIYGKKTAIIMWLAIGKPFAILVESEEISGSFRSYFNLLWKTAKPKGKKRRLYSQP